MDNKALASPTLGRLKHLWHAVVHRVDNGDKHEVDIGAYWDPENPLTDESVRQAAIAQAIRNDFKQQGGEVMPALHYGKAWQYFAVTEVQLVA